MTDKRRKPDYQPSTPRFRREEQFEEIRVHGFNACVMLFATHPERIIRAWIAASVAPRCGELMRYLAATRKAYHLVEEEELERVTASTHHEGICLLVSRAPAIPVGKYLRQVQPDQASLLLALDGVGNPHNLGAILRTAAHFGAAGICLAEPEMLQSGAAMRTAEGGAESVAAIACPDFAAGLRQLQKGGFVLVGTSSHKGCDLYDFRFPPKTVLLLGEEVRGLSPGMVQTADALVRIPGTGWVESLNVSCAAGILMAEFWRQHRG